MANSLTAYDPEVWAFETLLNLHDNFVTVGTVHRDFSQEIASFGDTVNTRQPAIFSVNTKGATSNTTIQDATATNVAVVLDQHKEVTFQLFDIEASRSFKDLAAEYIEPAAIAHADGMDSAITALYASATNEYAVGAVMSKAVVPGTRRRLLDNQVPLDGRVHFVMSTIAEEALLNEAQFTDADRAGDGGRAQMEAFLGKKYGLNLYVDQNINTTTGTPDVSNNLAYHRNAIALVTRPTGTALPPSFSGVNVATVQDRGVGLRSVIGYDINKLATQVTIDILYGVKILNQSLLLEVKTNDA